MATYILYINSSITPAVFSPSATYPNNPSIRTSDGSEQPIFESSLWKQLMNMDSKPAIDRSTTPLKENSQTEINQNDTSVKKRVRRFPTSLARLLEITARQELLYQQQLADNEEDEVHEASMTNDEGMASPPFMNKKTAPNTIASSFKHGDKVSLSYRSAKIGKGHFIQAGSNYLVWEDDDGDLRLQSLGDGIHIEKL